MSFKGLQYSTQKTESKHILSFERSELSFELPKLSRHLRKHKARRAFCSLSYVVGLFLRFSVFGFLGEGLFINCWLGKARNVGKCGQAVYRACATALSLCIPYAGLVHTVLAAFSPRYPYGGVRQ